MRCGVILSCTAFCLSRRAGIFQARCEACSGQPRTWNLSGEDNEREKRENRRENDMKTIVGIIAAVCIAAVATNGELTGDCRHRLCNHHRAVGFSRAA